MAGQRSNESIARITFKGTALKAVRLTLDLSQSELASRVGVSQASVYMYEAGYRLPSPEIQRRIGEALGVDPSALFPPLIQESADETTR